MRRAAYLATLAGAFGLGLVVAAQSIGPANAQPQPRQGEPLVVSASRTIGIRRCLSAIDLVSRRVTDGAVRQDILMDWDRARPDGGPLFALTGMSDGVRDGLYTLAAVPTPGPGGKCSLVAEHISVESSSCYDFASTTLAGYRSTALIDGITVYTSSARPSETFTLMTAGPSCLVIRRQSAFNIVASAQ